MSLRMHLGRRGSPLVERPECRGHAARGAPGPAGRRRWPALLERARASPPRSLDAIWDPAEGVDGLPAGARPSLGRPGRARGARAARSSWWSATAPPDRRARRSRCCSPSARCGSTWCAPGCARGSAWWPRPATPSTSTTSPASSATAPRRCTPGSRWPRSSRSFGEARSAEEADRHAASDAGRGGRALPLGRREGPAQDPVEDGHLDALVVLRRADLRGARPGPRGDRRRVLGHASPIGGVGFDEIAEDVLARHARGVRGGARRIGAARLRPRPLPQGRRGSRLGAAGRGGAAAGGEGRHGERRGVRRLPGQASRPAARRSARPAGHPARHAGAARRGRAGRSRSAAASCRRRCRSARCRPRRTRRSRSR